MKRETAKKISLLVWDALQTDRAHHKQWYLEKIAELMELDMPPHEKGIAP